MSQHQISQSTNSPRPNSEYSKPLSSPSSPFRTAFRTPRPPGIETGVREVPRTVSEHPEDLYDGEMEE